MQAPSQTSRSAGQVPHRDFEGEVEERRGDRITGWARAVGEDSSPVVVELWLDGTCVARAEADRPRKNSSASSLGEDRKGFELCVPARGCDGLRRHASVRVAGSLRALVRGEFEFEHAAFEGAVDACTEAGVTGWARRVDGTDAAVDVELWLDGQPCALVTADAHRADLASAGKGSGHHAYLLPWPASMLDGRARQIEVRVAGASVPLPGSGAHHSLRPAPRGFQGTLDAVTVDAAVGWASWADRREEPVEVELLVDGRAVSSTRADLPRDDLALAGFNDVRHAFSIALPEEVFDDQPHAFAVRVCGSEHVLNGSPVTLRLGAAELFARTGAVDVLRKHTAAQRLMTQAEALPDSALDHRLHEQVLTVGAWLADQPFVASRERARALLQRVGSARCRLDLDGMTAPTRVEGRLTDRWATQASRPAPVLQVQIQDESGAVIASGETTPLGRFALWLPEDLLDGRTREFTLAVPAYGTVLGPWRFMMLKPGRDDDPASRLVGDPIWGALSPAARDALRPAASAVQAWQVAVAEAGAAVDALPADAEPVRTARCWVRLGDALVQGGQPRDALAAYERARAFDPALGDAWCGEARCLAALGKPEAALAILAEARRRLPDEAPVAGLADRLAGEARSHSARLVAFYLPQFHPIPENDRWWGEGFTEWANVTAARPLFDGHLQPRRPTSLGFYDLRLAEAANAQFELARRYGIDGFCYYYYWFNGRRVLDRPLADLVAGRTGPFPFSICWANEDWTRSWDGATGDVLLAQDDTEEAASRFIEDIAPMLRHPDYIRVGGKPLVMVYRADRLDEPLKTVRHWRRWCLDNGIGELHLCAVQSFGFDDPRPLGFDAAVEFPPHCLRERYPEPGYHRQLHPTGMVDGFNGTVLDYQAFARAAIARPREAYTLHRTAMVAWDNTARRHKSAHVYHGFSIETYTRWVEHNVRCAAREQTDGICFVNAWNEWAEGSVMEPDAHFGHGVLEATRLARERALISPNETYWSAGAPQLRVPRLAAREHILLVGHDGHLHGAQINLLNMARCLRRDLQMDLTLLLLEDGMLRTDYERVATTHVIGRDADWRQRAEPLLRDLAARGVRKAICNTVVTGEVSALLKQLGFTVVGLVHELPALIETAHLQAHCWQMAAHADALVFASRLVASEFEERYWPQEERVVIAPQGVTLNGHLAQREETRARVREELGIAADTPIVMGCGYGDHRKGFDLFVRMAATLSRHPAGQKVAFLWVGKVAEAMQAQVGAELRRAQLEQRFFVTGPTREAPLYFAASDLFALTSREDPFPSVVMEAFDAGMPVVGFDGAGGFVDIVGPQTGALVPFVNTDAMSDALAELLADEPRRLAIGRHNHALCRERYTYEPYLRKLLALLDGVAPAQVVNGVLTRHAWQGPGPTPKVSVIVPNYNYAGYLELRLRTIVAQTLAPTEIIVLDDASTDASMRFLRDFADRSPVPLRVVASDTNTGSPFPQWARGLRMAQGDLVWIAEADDYCEPTLLETLVAEMRDPRTTLAWCDSVMVDEHGGSHGAQYKGYYGERYGSRWPLPFSADGMELIHDCLLVENVLPNASAVVFRRSAIRPADLDHLVNHRFSGDWWLWLMLASRGRVAYSPEPLNYHRRHSRSVMSQVLRGGAHLLDETLSFYQGLADSQPSMFSPAALRGVLTRLEQLHRMFPANTQIAARLSEHPAHAAAYRRFVASAQKAADAFPPPTGTALFVVDLALGESGALELPPAAMRVLETVQRECPATLRWRILALRPAGVSTAAGPARNRGDRAAAPSPRRHRPAAIEPNVADLRQAIVAASADGAVVHTVSHGLCAHALVGELQSSERGEWLLVAHREFDALLGQPPQSEVASVQQLRHAVAACTRVVYTTDTLPHPLARMARSLRRPLNYQALLPASSVGPDADGRVAVQVLGHAHQAAAAAWRAVASRLLDGTDLPVELTLLYTEGMDDESRRMHERSAAMHALFSYALPRFGHGLADCYVDALGGSGTRTRGCSHYPVVALSELLARGEQALQAYRPTGTEVS